jgi:hypothetical protein
MLTICGVCQQRQFLRFSGYTLSRFFTQKQMKCLLVHCVSLLTWNGAKCAWVAVCNVMCSYQGLLQIGSRGREVFLLHIPTFGSTHAPPPSPIYVQSRHEICTKSKCLWRWCVRINQVLPTRAVYFSTFLLALASTDSWFRALRYCLTAHVDSNPGTWSSHKAGSNHRKWRPCRMWPSGSPGAVGITRWGPFPRFALRLDGTR